MMKVNIEWIRPNLSAKLVSDCNERIIQFTNNAVSKICHELLSQSLSYFEVQISPEIDRLKFHRPFEKINMKTVARTTDRLFKDEFTKRNVDPPLVFKCVRNNVPNVSTLSGSNFSSLYWDAIITENGHILKTRGVPEQFAKFISNHREEGTYRRALYALNFANVALGNQSDCSRAFELSIGDALDRQTVTFFNCKERITSIINEQIPDFIKDFEIVFNSYVYELWNDRFNKNDPRLAYPQGKLRRVRN